ncbi:MAG: helix-turn-helix domain-containing protein, partial [Candidatus Scatosoma sp.]
KISALRHFYPEQSGFTINRKNGHEQYTFLHFSTTVEIAIGGELVRARPHACVIFQPHTPQYFHATEPLVHDWIHFSSVPEQYFESLSLQTDTLYYPKSAEFITELTREMEENFFAKNIAREELLQLKLRELFIRLSRAVYTEHDLTLDEEQTARLYAVRREMFLRLNEPWTVEKMAKRCGVSASRFFALYRSLFKTSPINDLIIARINNAKNALAESGASVKTVALNAGYENVTHFVRQFRQFTGMTPGEYRRKNGG